MYGCTFPGYLVQVKSTKALFITKKYLTLDGLIHLKKKNNNNNTNTFIAE